MKRIIERLIRIEDRVRILEEKADESLLERGIELPEEDFTRYALGRDHLSKLSDTLRKTMSTVERLVEATTFTVTEQTGRKRSLENANLNQLERTGFLCKIRNGRHVYFRSFVGQREEKYEMLENSISDT